MASIMSDEQRLKVLEAYDPKEHLIKVGTNKDGSPVLYYPANWRLYELSLRYPNANSDSEILHMDEKGNVIVRARVWLGKSYEESDKKAMAMKQGRVAELDKVEKKAKARAASDFGIGTEYALDFDDVDVNELQQKEQSHSATKTESSSQSKPEVRNTTPTSSDEPMTDQQRGRIEDLFRRLNKPVKLPATSAEAKELIAQLAGEYRESKKSA